MQHDENHHHFDNVRCRNESEHSARCKRSDDHDRVV